MYLFFINEVFENPSFPGISSLQNNKINKTYMHFLPGICQKTISRDDIVYLQL